MNTQLIICLIIFALTTVMFIWNKVPMAAVSLLAAIVLALTGCIEPKTVLSNIGNSNAVIMAATFVVAEGLMRTQMLDRISGLVYRISSGSWKKMMFGYCLVAAVLVEVTGNAIGTFAIMYPFLLALSEKCNISISKVVYPIGLICICNGLSVPIGISATTYLEFNGYLEGLNYTAYQFGFWDFFKGKFLICLLVTLYAALAATRLSPDESPVPVIGFENKKHKETAALRPLQEMLGYTIFLLVLIGLCLSDTIGIHAWIIVTSGALLMVLTGVLSEKEALNAVPWKIILLFSGCLCMSNALDNTGVAALLGEGIVTLLGNTRNGYFIGAVVFIIPFIVTQFMSNRATILMFVPVVISACKALGCNPIGPILLLITACGGAVFTPMGSPAVPVIMGAGGYNVKSMVKQGWKFALVFWVVSVFWIMTVFPAFPN